MSVQHLAGRRGADERDGHEDLTPARRALLYALRRRGDATAEQMAEQLGITVSGARQQLDSLVKRCLVVSTERVPATPTKGRRALRYSVSADADVLFPKAYGELANELLSCAAEGDPALVDDLFARRREHRITSAQRRLARKRTLAARVEELTKVLDEDGYLATCEHLGSGVHRIVEHNCAIWAVAQRYGQACSNEIEFIRAVLPSASVERVAHMAAGAPQCAYEIRRI